MSEANGATLDRLVHNLDGLRIGRLGINKCTAVNDVWLTVYALGHGKDYFGDEQLSCSPNELLSFCRRVVDIADAHLHGERETVVPDPCKTCSDCDKAADEDPCAMCGPPAWEYHDCRCDDDGTANTGLDSRREGEDRNEK